MTQIFKTFVTSTMSLVLLCAVHTSGVASTRSDETVNNSERTASTNMYAAYTAAIETFMAKNHVDPDRAAAEVAEEIKRNPNYLETFATPASEQPTTTQKLAWREGHHGGGWGGPPPVHERPGRWVTSPGVWGGHPHHHPHFGPPPIIILPPPRPPVCVLLCGPFGCGPVCR